LRRAGEHLGAVLDGAVAASVLEPGATRRTLTRLEAGRTFGEMAVLTGGAMIADIVAESSCEVLLIPVSLSARADHAQPRTELLRRCELRCRDRRLHGVSPADREVAIVRDPY
jgi:CRP-like cAMP-binding protein